MLLVLVKIAATVGALGILTVMCAMLGAGYEQRFKFRPRRQKVVGYSVLAIYYALIIGSGYLIWFVW